MLGDQDNLVSSLLSFVSQVTTSVFTLSQKFPSKCLSLSLHDIIVYIIEQGFSCLQFDMLAEVFHHKLQTALLLCSVTMTMAYVHIYYWGALVSPLRKASESSLIFWRPWGLRVSHVSVLTTPLSARFSWTRRDVLTSALFLLVRLWYFLYTVCFNEIMCVIQFSVFKFLWKQIAHNSGLMAPFL